MSGTNLKDWLREVCYFEPSFNGLSNMLIFKEFIDRIVGGHYECLMLEVDCSSFDFTCTGITICPYFEVVKETDTVPVQIVEDDYRLSSITVPPLVLLLKVEVTQFPS